jgi:hypothetical protein
LLPGLLFTPLGNPLAQKAAQQFPFFLSEGFSGPHYFRSRTPTPPLPV